MLNSSLFIYISLKLNQHKKTIHRDYLVCEPTRYKTRLIRTN